jgi:CrcB protein
VIHLLAIAAGGALGALFRYGVSNGMAGWLGRGFPFGTLTVNVLGSLLMGALYVLMLERLSVGAEWRAALQIGLLGAFTTFSTFSLETLLLIEEGDVLKAALNVVINVAVCLVAAWFGMVMGRQL